VRNSGFDRAAVVTAAPTIIFSRYGSSVLHEGLNFDISGCYSPNGSSAIPLGHNPNNRNQGFVYDVGPNSLTPGHSLWFGATRSGKGVSGIIPTLLTTVSSAVCIDPKGELAWITAERRRAMGQRVVILDPWNEVNNRYGSQVGVTEETTRFNPLSAIDPTSKDFNDDVTAIADALVVVDPNEAASHWTNSARSLIAGLIAAAIEAKPGKASLREVRALITSDDDTLVRNIHAITDANPNSLAARKLRRFTRVNKDGDAVVTTEISSIRSTAETQTDVLDSETLLDAMETDAAPFDLEELVRGKVTVYLVLPPDRLNTHGRWLRMFLTLSLRMVARQRKPPAMPVLFVLDEMGTVGSLRMIEDSYGLLAGLGVRLMGYLQDLSQLQRDYPRSWETFISNSSVIGVLQVGDETTAKYVSEYLGTRTIVHLGQLAAHTRQNPEWHSKTDTYKVLQSVQHGLAQRNNEIKVGPEETMTVWEPEESYHPRQVLLPAEVRNSPSDSLLLLIPGKFNVRLKRFIYYSDPTLSQWARPDPNKPRAQVSVPPPAPPAARPGPPPPPSAPGAPPPVVGGVSADLGKFFGGFTDRLGKK
jgi:type IV secretory pathway TraG/TraD family ATPase VirD4